MREPQVLKSAEKLRQSLKNYGEKTLYVQVLDLVSPNDYGKFDHVPIIAFSGFVDKSQAYINDGHLHQKLSFAFFQQIFSEPYVLPFGNYSMESYPRTKETREFFTLVADETSEFLRINFPRDEFDYEIRTEDIGVMMEEEKK